jgi:uncharacterized tellurite resistance protein B-like protein
MLNTPDFFTPAAPPAPSAQPLHITDEAEACAAVLLACRRADEINGPGGTAAFLTTLKSRNIFIGADPEALIETVGRYFEQAGSSAALIDAAMGAIREQTRLPLFYHCLDVILADGVVTPQEDRVFQYLTRKFKVDEEVAFNAMEVLVVKNQL